MRTRGVSIKLGIVALAGTFVAFAVSACVNEEVVSGPGGDRPIFEDPPAAAGNFLGFSEQEEGQTICGECHVGFQGIWEESAHADAWAGLQESAGAQEFCEDCHAVTELGNPTEGDVGWAATGDERYHDVQCESCHGPGLTHIENPDANMPLANIAVGFGEGEITTGCGECHDGSHHPFVTQWANSAHGNVTGFAAQREGCADCHDGETALGAQFGESSDFVEEDDGEFEQIVCATCHDPHGSEFEGQLRASVSVASENNLCVKCHDRKGTPSIQDPNFRGPHAFQGNLVLGEDVGWFPPNFRFDESDRLAGTHGTDANPRLCATCHVASFTVTDQASGEFQFESVGHNFLAIPCVDEDGIPTGETGCSLTLEARNFESCAISGCHGSTAAARNLMVNTLDNINDGLDALWEDSDGDAVLETTDGGLLPQVLAQDLADGTVDEINPFDQTFTVAEGALWNAQIAYTSERPHWGDGEIEGLDGSFGAHKGSGDGVHNPFLTEALLDASADAVADEYGLTAPASARTLEAEVPPGISASR
jgi:predicted CXXCH cytochrome family protein